MATVGRVTFADAPGAAELFSPEFVDYLTGLHDHLGARVHALRAARVRMLKRCLDEKALPVAESDPALEGSDWKVPDVPAELRKPGIEISGPASVTPMFINALNPMPDGSIGEGDLDDDEDSAGHRFVDTVTAAHNRMNAAKGMLEFVDEARGRHYKVQQGELPFFMHRERGLMLDEPDVTVDGKPVSATILGTALTLFYVGRVQAEKGQGIYFYLPKLETVEETAFYTELFDASRRRLAHLRDAVIRAIILVESLPSVYRMDEMLRALGEYGAGLNAARWDMQASILEYIMTDETQVWPDRFDVDIKTTEFLGNIFRRLVAVCLKRGAVPIGGMATALPHRNEEVNREAAAAIRADKEWEARQGFLRGWVAHIYHLVPAASPFKQLAATGWQPTPEMAQPENYPIKIEVPKGVVTVTGSRRNARTIIEYLEGWLGGRGAKGIDSLAGSPGARPALMEDLATARISVAQTAQRIIHAAAVEGTGEKHTFALVKSLLSEEMEDIIAKLKESAGAASTSPEIAAAEERYHKAARIAMRWIHNYTELNFRSLGSYTRAQLEDIAAAPDAF